MNVRSMSVKFLLALLLALVAPGLWAQDGLKGALSQANLSGPLDRWLAAADFDNDKRLDGVILLGSDGPRHRRIQVHFSGRPNAELTFDSNEPALTVAARDVNNDGDSDLVVEESLTHKPLHVWINKGNGDFREGSVEDFPTLAFVPREQVQSPGNQTECLSVCLPPQQGFSGAILTIPVLGRPPSASKLPLSLSDFCHASPTPFPGSPRAPPLGLLS